MQISNPPMLINDESSSPKKPILCTPLLHIHCRENENVFGVVSCTHMNFLFPLQPQTKNNKKLWYFYVFTVSPYSRGSMWKDYRKVASKMVTLLWVFFCFRKSFNESPPYFHLRWKKEKNLKIKSFNKTNNPSV